jgi:uncharacterized C2H2 Zn-finger protein
VLRHEQTRSSTSLKATLQSPTLIKESCAASHGDSAPRTYSLLNNRPDCSLNRKVPLRLNNNQIEKAMAQNNSNINWVDQDPDAIYGRRDLMAWFASPLYAPTLALSSDYGDWSRRRRSISIAATAGSLASDPEPFQVPEPAWSDFFEHERTSRFQTCDICLDEFAHHSGLLRHKVMVHKARENLQCPFCGKIYKRPDTLRRHVRDKHPEEDQSVVSPQSQAMPSSDQRHQCSHCSKVYKRKGALANHVKAHHDISYQSGTQSSELQHSELEVEKPNATRGPVASLLQAPEFETKELFATPEPDGIFAALEREVTIAAHEQEGSIAVHEHKRTYPAPEPEASHTHRHDFTSSPKRSSIASSQTVNENEILLSELQQAHPKTIDSSIDVIQREQSKREQSISENDPSVNATQCKPAEEGQVSNSLLSSSIAFSDSGYGTLPDCSRKILHTIPISSTESHVTETAVESGDAETVYSDAMSLSDARMVDYISALAEDLSAKLQLKDIGIREMERLSSALPTLLKALALNFGFEAPTQMHRDVMFFIHRHRKYVFFLYGPSI